MKHMSRNVAADPLSSRHQKLRAHIWSRAVVQWHAPGDRAARQYSGSRNLQVERGHRAGAACEKALRETGVQILTDEDIAGMESRL
jgi:hypothetical protein